MSRLAVAALLHAQAILGIEGSGLQAWEGADELPYLLRESFDFFELKLLGQPLLLVHSRAEAVPASKDLLAWFGKIQALERLPVVYVTESMVSFERRRLIEHKIPFIVPGNQLYLPNLGLDLREHFRQRTPEPCLALSPSAQALFIAALLRRPWQSEWLPGEAAAALGYSAMTLSRAVNELTATGLACAYSVGRTRWLRMELPLDQMWEQMKPLLRTPVKRTVWVEIPDELAGSPRRQAGLSALARHSMLVEPSMPICAVSSAEWKAAVIAGVRELPEPKLGAQAWQIWSYSPALAADAPTVDVLSLMLSLQENQDERVQMALDDLKQHLPW